MSKVNVNKCAVDGVYLLGELKTDMSTSNSDESFLKRLLGCSCVDDEDCNCIDKVSKSIKKELYK